MNLFGETLLWLADPNHWTGPDGIPTRLAQHVALTLTVIAIAGVIALPIGAWMGHTRRGEATIATLVNGSRALPTLGLVTLFALWLGIGVRAPLIALVILAIPSIVAATYSGISSASPAAVEAARALGHTSWQTLTRVEAPLAMPTIGGGFQSALVQVVATATIAAYVADVGLGRYIFAGLKSRDYPEMLAGSVLTIMLALLVTAAAAGVGHLYRMLTINERTPG
jgi:osmoprotectant transport system permease protein